MTGVQTCALPIYEKKTRDNVVMSLTTLVANSLETVKQLKGIGATLIEQLASSKSSLKADSKVNPDTSKPYRNGGLSVAEELDLAFPNDIASP